MAPAGVLPPPAQHPPPRRARKLTAPSSVTTLKETLPRRKLQLGVPTVRLPRRRFSSTAHLWATDTLFSPRPRVCVPVRVLPRPVPIPAPQLFVYSNRFNRFAWRVHRAPHVLP